VESKVVEVLYISSRLSKSGALNWCHRWLKTHDKLPKAIIKEYETKSGNPKKYYMFVEPVSTEKLDLRRTYWRDEKELKDVII
jgi:hypothetical protein